MKTQQNRAESSRKKTTWFFWALSVIQDSFCSIVFVFKTREDVWRDVSSVPHPPPLGVPACVPVYIQQSSSLCFWRYFVVTGFTKVSLSLLVSVRPPRSLLSLHFDVAIVTMCWSASPSLRFCPSLCLLPLPALGLMLFRCDRSRVNPCISFYRLSFSLPLMCFPSEVKKLCSCA